MFQKSLELTKIKALMIKINVLINNIKWFRYIKNPNSYLDRKLNKLNSIEKILKIFKYEFDRLWIHGLVHLLGYDHKKEKDFLKMRQIEKKYFDTINV